MAESIHDNRHKTGNMKLTITNFQKIEDQIKTTMQSTCEIDFDVCDILINFILKYTYLYLIILVYQYKLLCNILGLTCCNNTDI